MHLVVYSSQMDEFFSGHYCRPIEYRIGPDGRFSTRCQVIRLSVSLSLPHCCSSYTATFSDIFHFNSIIVDQWSNPRPSLTLASNSQSPPPSSSQCPYLYIYTRIEIVCCVYTQQKRGATTILDAAHYGPSVSLSPLSVGNDASQRAHYFQ